MTGIKCKENQQRTRGNELDTFSAGDGLFLRHTWLAFQFIPVQSDSKATVDLTALLFS